MSVRADRPPNPKTMIGAIDEEAQATVRRAQERIAPIVSAQTPRGRTGKVANALRPRVSKTKSGGALTVRAPRSTAHDGTATIAQVVKWLTKGTGVHREGPGPKKPIRANRRWRGPRAVMILPGGKQVRKVAGQHPNPFMDRIFQTASPVVERTFEEGATAAARAVERTL